MAVYVIISLLAIYGLFHLISDITLKIKIKSCSGKLCLLPSPGDEGLEGKIRCIFMEDVSEKLGMDGYLYIKLEKDDPNRKLVEKLSFEYPRLVLMENVNWGRMECDEKLRIYEKEEVSNG
ncbi:MAG: hypothetical protein GX283_02280 [Clostridiaceae bacterium]|jgi:hypothetical protein|nr:hypothetical protein [Clostridiaceae bacterium]